jgi:FkbM family methyltransferase
MRRLLKTVKPMVERLFGIRIYSARPHGRDDCHDMQRTGVSIRTIFDVGAHKGESAMKFERAFPGAAIHSFEPVSATFATLQAAVAGHANVHCHRLALSDTAGTASIYLTAHSTTSSLVRPELTSGEESVPVTTVDQFAGANGIDRIDLLKVDAEGHDLDVLRGAARTLGEGRVAFVLAEVGFSRSEPAHVLFDDVRDYLAGHRFATFGIYDQQLEWSGENRLRYANACFCHETVVMQKRPVT